jgi:hypothetical protein
VGRAIHHCGSIEARPTNYQTRKAKSSPTLGTLNSYVAFFLKASRLCKLFHYLINKEYSGVQSFVFITTMKD